MSCLLGHRALLFMAAVFVLLFPVKAATQTAEPILHVTLAFDMVAHGADMASTMYCAGARTCREANPMFAPFINTPMAAGAWKMALASGSAYFKLRLHRQHPRVVFWWAAAEGSLMTWLAVRTARRGPS